MTGLEFEQEVTERTETQPFAKGKFPYPLFPPVQIILLFIAILATTSALPNGIGSRFAYLSEDDPYYPHGDFPKFTVPSWIGEPEVEAVIVLSIDDMCRPFPKSRPQGLPTYARQPKVYFDFLKPIADRLFQIDGRAPISVFSLQLDPDDKVVRQMLKMGMSMECHTFTHPVPLMRAAKDENDSLALVHADFTRSVDSLFRVENNRPIAHRTPGCDARNTASPRFFTEIFPHGDLRMDSSIFTAYLKPDPKLPQEWYFLPDGTHRFASRISGIPYTKTFVNYVEDYPYPYVINNRLWELPAIIPGDAHGVHAYGRRSDKTIEDWKRALDITVAKQGVMTICFHPHGYIDAEQIVALIDYAVASYGKKIKFLNCREVLKRIEKNTVADFPIGDPATKLHSSRYLDIDGDHHIDILLFKQHFIRGRIWNPSNRSYADYDFFLKHPANDLHFFTADRRGNAGFAQLFQGKLHTWRFRDGRFLEASTLKNIGSPKRLHFRDLNGDGVSDIIADKNAFLSNKILRWTPARFQLPLPLSKSMRFIDLDHDEDDDLVFANESEYAIWLYENPTTGWSKKLLSGKGSQSAPVPPITLDGQNAGAWFRRDEMAVVNEFTANPKTDHVIIRNYRDWLDVAKSLP
jgi:hypothetical protein